MVKFKQLPLLGILLATVVSAGAISLNQLSKPTSFPKHCANTRCVKQSDCGICFCNTDLGNICMIEPLAKNKARN